MNQPNWMEKIGATPAKLALVVVLGITFMAVVFPQLIGTSTTAADAHVTKKRRPQGTTQKAEATNDNNANAKEDIVKTEKADWPEVDLQDALQHDPLATPSWYAVKEQKTNQASQIEGEDGRRQRIRELEKEGARIVVITDQEKAATIGEKKVQIGDIIEGFQVSNITTEGIVLTEMLSN